MDEKCNPESSKLNLIFVVYTQYLVKLSYSSITSCFHPNMARMPSGLENMRA